MNICWRYMGTFTDCVFDAAAIPALPNCCDNIFAAGPSPTTDKSQPHHHQSAQLNIVTAGLDSDHGPKAEFSAWALLMLCCWLRRTNYYYYYVYLADSEGLHLSRRISIVCFRTNCANCNAWIQPLSIIISIHIHHLPIRFPEEPKMWNLNWPN